MRERRGVRYGTGAKGAAVENDEKVIQSQRPKTFRCSLQAATAAAKYIIANAEIVGTTYEELMTFPILGEKRMRDCQENRERGMRKRDVG